MARRRKQKLLTALPQKFDPDFIEKLSRRYALTHVIYARRAELQAEYSVGGQLTYSMRALIKLVLWQELIADTLAQAAANGQQVDVGALTQLGNSIKGLFGDLREQREELMASTRLTSSLVQVRERYEQSEAAAQAKRAAA